MTRISFSFCAPEPQRLQNGKERKNRAAPEGGLRAEMIPEKACNNACNEDRGAAREAEDSECGGALLGRSGLSDEKRKDALRGA